MLEYNRTLYVVFVGWKECIVGASSSTVMLVLTIQVGKVTMNKLIDVPRIIISLVLGNT